MALYIFIFDAEPGGAGSPPGRSTDHVLATVIVKATEPAAAEARARDCVAANGHSITRLAVARGPMPKVIWGLSDGARRQIHEAETRGIGLRFMDLPKAPGRDA
jgi:hypothetical protein